jgi:hypothetical protein
MPVQNRRLRVTDKLPADYAKRMIYRTRRMLADDDPLKRQPVSEGEEFEAPPSDAEFYLQQGWAEDVGGAVDAPRQRTTAAKKKPTEAAQSQSAQSRPQQQQPSSEQQQPSQSEQSSQQREPGQETPTSLEEMTRPQLLELAEKHAVELPPGYVAHAELVKALQQAGISHES